MNDPFKLQYRSQNLAKLQDMFVNDVQMEFLTSYRITNQSARASKREKLQYELVSDKRPNELSPTKQFIKKYNKVLNEFCIPQGKQFITVDLDEKLKLNFLQSQIDKSRVKGQKSNKSKLDDVKINYILGSPNKQMKKEHDLSFNMSPRQSIKRTSYNETVSTPSYFSSKNNLEFIDLSENPKTSFLKVNKHKCSFNRAVTKNEIISTLYDDGKKGNNVIEKIGQIRVMQYKEESNKILGNSRKHYNIQK